MNKQREWQYIITPGLVGRMTDEVLEICRLDNSQWEVSTDPLERRMFMLDGMAVSREEALEIHELYKSLTSSQ